mgnify:CR=1 FL=1
MHRATNILFLRKMHGLSSFILFTAFVLLLGGCATDELPEGVRIATTRHRLYVGTSSLTLGAESNLTTTLHIDADNTAWAIRDVPSEWLTVSPSSGSSSADVTVTAQANTNVDEARVATITLYSTEPDHDYSRPVSVTQPGLSPIINVSRSSLSFDAQAATQTVEVTANVEWTAQSSDASWLSVAKQGDTELAITTTENLSASRTATISLLRAGSSTVTATISVTQGEGGVTGSQETLTFGVSGETKTCAIHADVSWTAYVSNTSWLSVTPASGSRGDATLSITATANNSNSQRDGYVYVRIGNTDKLAVPIRQEGISYAASPSELSFNVGAGKQELTVTANTSWQLLSKPNWLTVSPAQGSGTATVSVEVEANPNTTGRSGNITFGRSGLSNPATVSVTQAGRQFDDITDLLEFGNKASSQTVDITTNGTWNATTASDWIHLSPASGTGSGTLTVAVDANTGETTRQGSVDVTVGTTTQTITVRQSGSHFDIGTVSALTNSKAATIQMSVSSNVEWTASSSASWLTLSPTSGSSDATITISVADNPSVNSRTATVSVKTSTETKSVTIAQPGRTLTLDCSSLSFTADGGRSQTITITTDGSYTVSKTASWLTISKTSNTFTVTASANTDTSERSGSVVVALTGLNSGESLQRTITVTQEGKQQPQTTGTKTYTANGVQFKMVYVEGGTFTMGATSEQGSDAWDDEKPTHQVTLSSFSIGETEVTQELWEAVMGSNPSYFTGNSQRPVEEVSWNDCQTFITKLNALTGQTFRLPTEAEWEYAARGGNQSKGYKYSGSNTIGDVAWYWYNIPSQTSGTAGYGTQPVGTKSPNELGLYDMSGNVWEWCSDAWYSYESSSQTNPTHPGVSGSSRVYRGGGWYDCAGRCRVSIRNYDAPTYTRNYLGLRLAL